MRRSTQNDSHALAPKKQGGERVCTTLQDDIEALIQSLQARANSLNKKRCCLNDRVHWIVRGRQRALRRVSAHLCAVEAAALCSHALYLALQEYLACLDKCCIDAEEERRNGLPRERWKAEGEAQELPRIVRLLSRMVQAQTPDFIGHTLSLDGKRQVPSRCENGGRALGESVPAKERMVDSETHRVSALAPVRSETPVPILGPFPPLLDPSQQRLLLTLEDALAHHARVLVNVKHGAEETMDLLLLFLDRVLQYTSLERILVFAGSVQLLPHLRQRYRTWVSRENGVPLSEYSLTQYTPTAPLAPDTRICFSSIREMQLLTRSLDEEDVVLSRHTFDLIIVYELASLTAPWQQVLAYFDAPYAVGIGSQADQTVAHAFDDNIITPERACSRCEGRDGPFDHREH